MQLNKLVGFAGFTIILQTVGILCVNRRLGCPKNWKRFKNSCYMSPRTTANWFNAQENCTKYNAHLVTISSQSENSFLIREIITKRQESRHFWIGLQRAPFDVSLWLWVDGSVLTYSGWYPGQPDYYRQEEYCGEMYVLQLRSGVVGWNDLNCSHASSFICEKDLTGLPSCSKDNGGCQHLCVWTLSDRRICKCKDGYISQKDGAVCLDPKMFMPHESQAQTTTSFDVASLVIQLLSLTLLMPISCVLVSFYKRVSRQRRRNKIESRTLVASATLANDEQGLDNQTSSFTSATFDNADNGEDTCRA